MKHLIRIFRDDYRQENFSIVHWVGSFLFLVLLVLACCLAEWLNAKYLTP